MTASITIKSLCTCYVKTMSETVPQVFVGTMYSGEGDYDKCCQAILGQRNVNIQHSVIANLSEHEAHNRLWSSWRSLQHSGYVAFIKVDADTVLANDEVLSNFCKLLIENPRVTGIQAPLLDYFTDGYINGLNCFSPKVTFLDTTDPLYCDRKVDVDHDVVIGSNMVPMSLRPAGYHCFQPTTLQAFHYGLHRQLKNQTTTINAVRVAFHRYRDRFRGMALLGANMSVQLKESFNYTDDRFQVAFEAADKRYDQLIKDEL